MQLNFDYAKLKEALTSATAEAFAQTKAVAEAESLYVFGLYISREGTSITPTAKTEAGLTRLAQEYAHKYGKPKNLGSVLDLWKQSNSPTKLIAVDEQPNYNVMQPSSFGKTNCFTS
ncbi:DUF4303 domain-containing protein [Trichocoleus desertorum AS-A10]|uniref:DUF4303 domain-containing protein n=1 Tax=Trichocoleus desertorum TaxID=1481672 RepID=UPI00329CC157